MSRFMTFLETCFQADWAERVGWTLLHSLWQIALVAAAYSVVTLMLRNRTAAARYVVGCVALLAMLGLPMITFVLLPCDVASFTDTGTDTGVKHSPTAAMAPVDSIELPRQERPGVEGVAAITALRSSETTRSADVPATGGTLLGNFSSWLRPYLPWATAIWLVGVVLLSLRPLWGWLHVRRLQQQGLTPLAVALQRVGERLIRQLGVRRAVRFAQSALVEVPTVVGYLRPLVLLPASAIAGLSTSEIELILAHELAHVRRHDYLVNLAQTVIEALLFYHPGMWWLSRQIRQERENCCDDVAVSLSESRATYVRALARLEEQRSLAPAAVLAATGGSLLGRIRRVIGQPAVSRTPRDAWLAGALVLLMVCVLMPFALALGSGEVESVASNLPKLTEADSKDFYASDTTSNNKKLLGRWVSGGLFPVISTFADGGVYVMECLNETGRGSWRLEKGDLIVKVNEGSFQGESRGPILWNSPDGFSISSAGRKKWRGYGRIDDTWGDIGHSWGKQVNGVRLRLDGERTNWTTAAPPRISSASMAMECGTD